MDRTRPKDLRQVKLSVAELYGASMRGTVLKGVTGITREELEQQAESLAGATMPDGTMHD